MALYVDDLLIATPDEPVLRMVKQVLESKFQIKYQGSVKHCLGIRIDYDQFNGHGVLSQSKKVKELVEDFGTNQCTEVDTTMQ